MRDMKSELEKLKGKFAEYSEMAKDESGETAGKAKTAAESTRDRIREKKGALIDGVSGRQKRADRNEDPGARLH